MLDFEGDTPAACPPASVLSALRGEGRPHSLMQYVGPGSRAARDPAGGFFLGRLTLVRVNGGEPQTWEQFAQANAALGKGELRAIYADLKGNGLHLDATATFTVALVPATLAPEPSDARAAAEAELARLDALICHLGEARRRYTADTPCNAWTLEQAALDVARAAQAAAKAFALRSEAA